MKRALMIGTALAFVMTPMFALGQGRPGGQGAGQKPRQTQSQKGQAGKTVGKGDMDRDHIRQQLHTHATDQERDQYRTCTQDMDQLRTRARDMVRATDGSNFNVEKARQQQAQFREQFQSMQQQHQQFMSGLDQEQKSAMQNRIRNMEQTQSRINTRLQEMENELNSNNINQQRIRDHARYLQREMQRLQNEHRAMGEDLSLSQA